SLSPGGSSGCFIASGSQTSASGQRQLSSTPASYTPRVPQLDPLAAFRLDGRVAIVTGASSGLGARFARVLDAAGARVVLAARRRERLQKLASELTDAEPGACDLSQPDAPGALVDAAPGRFRRGGVPVHDAGKDA